MPGKDAGARKGVGVDCGTCKCRKKTSVFGHPQDVNAASRGPLGCGGRYVEGCWRQGNEVDD